MQTELPVLPGGFRWHVTRKRTWTFLALQRHGWLGWRTISKTSLNPCGMGIDVALRSASRDILDDMNMVNIG